MMPVGMRGLVCAQTMSHPYSLLSNWIVVQPLKTILPGNYSKDRQLTSTLLQILFILCKHISYEPYNHFRHSIFFPRQTRTEMTYLVNLCDVY